MKKGIILFTAFLAMGLYVMGCSSEEGTTDTHIDTTPDTVPDTTPDTVPDTRPDTLPDTIPDTMPDITPDIVPDNPIEVIPDGTGESYGTINVQFNSPFIYDRVQFESSDTYWQAHPEGIIGPTASYTGVYGTAKTIPGVGSVVSQAYALHVPAGTTPATVIVQQTSFNGTDPTAQLVNPAIQLAFAGDAITTGTLNFDMTSATSPFLGVFNVTGTTSCILAFADGGSINVTAATNTTATDGGTLAFNGSSIPIYHPTNFHGVDVSGEFTSAGFTICPIE